MKLDEIRAVMARGRLSLPLGEWVDHYFSPVFLGLIASVLAYMVFSVIDPRSCLMFGALPMICAGAWIYYLDRQLVLESIETPLSRKAAFRVLDRVCLFEGWSHIKRTARLYIGVTPDGDIVTVIADEGKVWCSSRCKPERISGFRQIFRNERNANKVLSQIRLASQDPVLLAMK